MGCGVSKVGSHLPDAVVIINGPVYKLNTAVTQRSTSFCGVSLSHLRKLAQEFPPGTTTADVVNTRVKIQTANLRCRYVDILAASEVDTPTHFVSHMWRMPFHNVVDLINSHVGADQDPDETHIWMDIFCVNQHEQTDDQMWTYIHEALAVSHQVLFCVDSAGHVFSRLWCLYELWTVAQMGHAAKVHVLSDNSGYRSMRTVFDSFDVAHARTTCPQDAKAILAQMRRSVNFPLDINSAVRKAMTENARQQAEMARQVLLMAGSSALDAVPLMTRAAEIFHAVGESVAAEKLYRTGLATRERAQGPTHPDTMQALVELGELLVDVKNYEDAGPLLSRAIKAAKSNTLITARALNAQTRMLQAQGKYNEAKTCLVSALEIHVELQGAQHPATAADLHDLASVMAALGRSNEAEEQFHRALTLREHLLGPGHPDTMMTAQELATLLRKQGAHEKAEPLFRRVLASREAALGPEHPDTGAAVRELALTVWTQGKTQEAEQLYRRALASDISCLGAGHPTTAADASTLAQLLEASGKNDEAIQMYRWALRVQDESMGANDPNASTTASHLAALLEARGQLDEALALFRRALRVAEETYGPGHPETAAQLKHVADVMRRQGRVEEADALLRLARSASKPDSSNWPIL